MASLYKKPVMITDPATGEKVKQKSRKWWGQYKDADGRLCRKPLAVDKAAAKAMLNEIVKRIEREKAGLIDPTEEQRRRPLSVHLQEFESYLTNRDVTPACTRQTLSQVRRMIDEQRWKTIADITASGALEFLGRLRRRHGMATKKFKRSERLFPLSTRVKGGVPRRTCRMVKRDLMAARNKWIEEATTAEEKSRRLDSDFLCHCNHDGLYADFHSLRHLFITNLARAGVSPKMAQTLATHADIRLTLGLYTHVELHDQTAAIESLPAPPSAGGDPRTGPKFRATGTDG